MNTILYTPLLILVLSAAMPGDTPISGHLKSPNIGHAFTPSTMDTKLDYTYPANIFAGRRFRDSEIEFYPIGISDDGLFALVERPCDGGCGCCTHKIQIINLTTDKPYAELDLNKDHEEIEDHKREWRKQAGRIENFLENKRISQMPLPVNSSPVLNYMGHTYKVSVSTRNGTDNDEYLGNSSLKYTVTVKLDNSKIKIVSKGAISDGAAFQYLGYIQSPFDAQIALLFNKSYDGWEAEHVNEVVVVGCKLDPKYFK
jgi:hypothetical protein